MAVLLKKKKQHEFMEPKYIFFNFLSEVDDHVTLYMMSKGLTADALNNYVFI